MPIVALLLPVLLVMTAFAVDLGRQRSSRTSMQAIADVVSLDMSRLADGRTVTEIQLGDAQHPAAETALAESAARNGIDRGQLSLDWGVWDEATGYQSLNGAGDLVPNAAKVVATELTDYYFQPGEGRATREAVAVYGSAAHAGFSVGSFAATAETSVSQLLDDLLSPYIDDGNPVEIDAPVELDAASYRGLALADVGIGELAAALTTSAVTPKEALDLTAQLDDVMLAAATVLRNQGNVAEADLVEGSVTTAMSGLSVRIGDYVRAEPGAEGSAMGASVDIPTLIAWSVFQSQCDTNALGFEECNGITVPNLTTTLPLTDSVATAKIIESARYHYGPTGTGTDTSQVQLDLMAVAGSQHVGDCTPTLSNLGCLLDGLLVETVDAEVAVEATVTSAGGRTSIADIGCEDPAVLGLGLSSATDLYDVDLRVTVKFGTRGLLGGLLGTVFAEMTLIGDTAQLNGLDDVQFTVAPDVLGETVRTTGNPTIGLAPVSLTSNGTAQGVIDDLAYLGIDYTLDELINNLVNPLLADIDGRVLDPLSELLGLNVSGSDLVAWAIDCDPGFVELAQ